APSLTCPKCCGSPSLRDGTKRRFWPARDGSTRGGGVTETRHGGAFPSAARFALTLRPSWAGASALVRRRWIWTVSEQACPSTSLVAQASPVRGAHSGVPLSLPSTVR